MENVPIDFKFSKFLNQTFCFKDGQKFWNANTDKCRSFRIFEDICNFFDFLLFNCNIRANWTLSYYQINVSQSLHAIVQLDHRRQRGPASVASLRRAVRLDSTSRLMKIWDIFSDSLMTNQCHFQEFVAMKAGARCGQSVLYQKQQHYTPLFSLVYMKTD